jgi:hypothetical protein
MRSTVSHRSIVSVDRDIIDDAIVTRRALTAREGLASRSDDVAGLRARIPETPVHGGFGTKNVHVRERVTVPEFLPVHWEAARRGVPAIDPARLFTPAGDALWCASSTPGEADTLASPWDARVMGKIGAYADEMEGALAALSWNRGRS